MPVEVEATVLSRAHPVESDAPKQPCAGSVEAEEARRHEIRRMTGNEPVGGSRRDGKAAGARQQPAHDEGAQEGARPRRIAARRRAVPPPRIRSHTRRPWRSRGSRTDGESPTCCRAGGMFVLRTC
ncbi:hypothetical protein DK419_00895 [Methylobacterium terrae]|uniref:Uncharacterized protein n=1 Tax=Methylobacterium terrae TaxID=2202827 RepID=A0A2U8WIA1_9HYPH|nr:hypothetical protein DK419_00895 [Methylobacterium terrae]